MLCIILETMLPTEERRSLLYVDIQLSKTLKIESNWYYLVFIFEKYTKVRLKNTEWLKISALFWIDIKIMRCDSNSFLTWYRWETRWKLLSAYFLCYLTYFVHFLFESADKHRGCIGIGLVESAPPPHFVFFYSLLKICSQPMSKSPRRLPIFN